MRAKCDSIQRLLSDYIDGILPDGQVKRIDQHLSSCSKCRTALSLLEETNRILGLYIEKEPPVGYFNKVWTQIESEITSRKKRKKQELIRNVIPVIGLKFRMLVNKIYDEFVWWADQIRWSKLLWQTVMVIMLVFSAIAIDRTYFRPSLPSFHRNSDLAMETNIDKTCLQKITQSLSKDRFYLIYSQNSITDHTSRKTRITRRKHITEVTDYTENTQKNLLGNSALIPCSLYSVEFCVLRDLVLDPDRIGDYSQKDQLNFVNLFSPKDITRVKITHLKDTQLQIDSVNIQDIQQSFMRRKYSNNKSPFRVFLADASTFQGLMIDD